MRRLIILSTLAIIMAVPAVLHAQEDPDPGAESGGSIQDVDPYNVYSSGLFQEVYIDEDFKLYKVRIYQGTVPGRDAEENVEQPLAESPRGKPKIDRLGFEQRELFSRVFVLADRPMSPWVYDNFVQAQADPHIPYQVFVELAGARIPTTNDKRPLVTRAFNTPISTIVGTETKDGVRVVLTLKREARYLPVQVGNVIYIDVER